MSSKPLYLASQSPRRKELLEQLGLKFKIFIPQKAELIAPKKIKQKNPAQIVREIALHKALAAHEEILLQKKKRGVIVAADTLVFLQKKVLGKPKNRGEALKMLQKLSGKTHIVATAVSILYFNGNKMKQKTIVVKSRVSFYKLSRQTLHWYLRTPEPYDKAGAYGAQSLGAVFIEKFSGSYTNVVGLPLSQTIKLLENVTGEKWQTWQK